MPDVSTDSEIRRQPVAEPPGAQAPPPKPERLTSLDAFRGAIMLLMASSGFGIQQVAEHFAGSPLWAFPPIVAGLNPINLYVLWQLFAGPVRNALKIHLGPHVFDMFGELYAPVVQRVSVLVIFWLILYWLWRRKIFVRL